MNKKILAVILSLIMVMTAVPSMAFAAGGNGSGGGNGGGDGSGTEQPASEVSIKLKGGIEQIQLGMGQTETYTANVKGLKDGEYHVHWTKTDGKKHISFVVNGAATADDMTEGMEAAIQGTLAGTGELTLEVIKGGSHSEECQGEVLSSLVIPAVVAGEASATGYGPQGIEGGYQQLEMVKPAADDITVVYPAAPTDAKDKYINKIGTPFEYGKDQEFRFTYAKEMGMGGQFDKDKFMQSTIAKISVTDRDGNIAASFEKGNLFYTGYDAVTRYVSITIDKAALKDGEYTMTFPKDCYAGKAENAIGVPVSFTFTVKGEPAPAPEPITVAAPTGIKAVSQNYNTAKISWKKAANADGYILYRWNSAKKAYTAVKTIASPSAVSCTNTNLTAGREYIFRVKAYRMADGKKVLSSGSAKVRVKTRPNAPAITVKAGVRKATVTWKGVAGASGYTVYRATGKTGTYKALRNVDKTKRSYTGTKLTKNKTYYYKVKAYRLVNGKKVFSNASAAKAVKVR